MVFFPLFTQWFSVLCSGDRSSLTSWVANHQPFSRFGPPSAIFSPCPTAQRATGDWTAQRATGGRGVCQLLFLARAPKLSSSPWVGVIKRRFGWRHRTEMQTMHLPMTFVFLPEWMERWSICSSRTFLMPVKTFCSCMRAIFTKVPTLQASYNFC